MIRLGDALVVDASIAVKWYLRDEDHAPEALNLLERFTEGALTLLAPAQLRYEIPAAITVATRLAQPRLSLPVARLAIEKFLALDLTTVDDDDLVLAAYDVAHRYGCAFYDALYLALAQRFRIPLVHADGRLQRLVGHLPDVVWIADFPNV